MRYDTHTVRPVAHTLTSQTETATRLSETRVTAVRVTARHPRLIASAVRVRWMFWLLQSTCYNTYVLRSTHEPVSRSQSHLGFATQGGEVQQLNSGLHRARRLVLENAVRISSTSLTLQTCEVCRCAPSQAYALPRDVRQERERFTCSASGRRGRADARRSHKRARRTPDFHGSRSTRGRRYRSR